MLKFEAEIVDTFHLKSRGYVISCQIHDGKVMIGDGLEVIPKAGTPFETKVIGIAIGGTRPIRDHLIDLLIPLPKEPSIDLAGATVRILADS